MIRQRMFGADVPFMAWLRSQQKELPSYSANVGFMATDIDLFIHRYMTEVDSVGTREIQALMQIEVKTHNGMPHDSQRDTMAKVHACCPFREVKYDRQILRHFGVSFLLLSNTTPDDSEEIIWGRFDNLPNQNIKRTPITIEQLFKLLRFELHPDNLEPRPLRRHHKTKEVYEVRKAALGFKYLHKITKRS